jgi:hypothetical protein
MGRFTTDKLNIFCSNIDPDYNVGATGRLDVPVNVVGRWPHRPIGRRMFTDEEIRAIRVSEASQRHLAEVYGCSHVSIYMIKKRAHYGDVI